MIVFHLTHLICLNDFVNAACILGESWFWAELLFPSCFRYMPEPISKSSHSYRISANAVPLSLSFQFLSSRASSGPAPASTVLPSLPPLRTQRPWSCLKMTRQNRERRELLVRQREDTELPVTPHTWNEVITASKWKLPLFTISSLFLHYSSSFSQLCVPGAITLSPQLFFFLFSRWNRVNIKQTGNMQGNIRTH